MADNSSHQQNRNPVSWLAHKAKEGVTELPSNTAWLLSRAVTGRGTSQSSSDRDAGKPGVAARARESVADAVPGGKDSLDVRIDRAQHALEDARRSEQQAFELSRTAKDLADTAKRLADDGRRRQTAVKKENQAEVARQVKEAQKRADQFVAEQRSKAEAEADKKNEQVAEQVTERNEQAQAQAEQAKADADSAIEAAAEQMADARRLADDAAAQAREAASEAHRRAQQLADQADQRAEKAQSRVAEIEGMNATIKKETAGVVKAVNTNSVTEDLSAMTKKELVELATALDVEGKTSLRKDELITAIKKAQRSAASTSPRQARRTDVVPAQEEFCRAGSGRARSSGRHEGPRPVRHKSRWERGEPGGRKRHRFRRPQEGKELTPQPDGWRTRERYASA